jgi:hypothetical protein
VLVVAQPFQVRLHGERLADPGRAVDHTGRSVGDQVVDDPGRQLVLTGDQGVRASQPKEVSGHQDPSSGGAG